LFVAALSSLFQYFLCLFPVSDFDLSPTELFATG
jgi:hypothetical protein